MKQISRFRFEENGLIIEFSLVPIEGGTVQKYSYSIVGNPELTEKLLSLKTKKVKEKDFFFCAKAIFEIINSKPKFKDDQKIKVIETFVKKGPEGETYYKINLIHKRGSLIKNFSLVGGCLFGAKGDWEDIFNSGLQGSYQKFLREFGIEIPSFLMRDEIGKYESVLEFEGKFIFEN